MERELLKQINLKGIKSKIFSLKLTGKIVLDFSRQSYQILKDFSGIKKNRKTLLISFFLDNIQKYFKKKKTELEEALSQYLSVMSLHKLNGEVELYHQMFYHNINFRVAGVFLKCFDQLSLLQAALYERPNKLLMNTKVDIKRALDLGARLLKDDFSITNFSNALSKYFESRRTTHNVISADILTNILLSAFQIGSKNAKKKKTKEGGVFLNWDRKDPQMFAIEVEKPELPTQSSKKQFIDLKTSPQPARNHEMDMNQINYEFMKKQKKILKTSHAGEEKKAGKPNWNIMRICSKYVFEEAPYHPALQANPFPHLSKKSGRNFLGYVKVNKFASARNFNKVSGRQIANEEESLDEDLKFLKEKLEASRKQLEIQKNLWKLVLSQGRDAVKNYRETKSELDGLERINDVMLSIVDKNTQQWKELALIKNSGLEELGKYKFLLATLLEDCSAELNKDLSDFKFAGNESINIVDKGPQGFDLYDYLNSRSRPTVSDFTYKKNIKLKVEDKKSQEQVREAETEKRLAEQYESLIEDLTHFPDELGEDSFEDGRADQVNC